MKNLVVASLLLAFLLTGVSSVWAKTKPSCCHPKAQCCKVRAACCKAK